MKILIFVIFLYYHAIILYALCVENACNQNDVCKEIFF
jgi:hypothetical protein